MGEGSREDRTIYVRNIDNKVTEEILYDLFLQAGPLISVKRPKDPDGNSRPFAFVEFEHDVSPPYARSLMDGIKLFGRNINVQFRSGSRHSEGSRGSSPTATPPHYSNGPRQNPAQNGSPSFLATPPMVQRSVSAPQGLLGSPGQGLHPMGVQGVGYPPNLAAPLMGNYPVSGFAQGILGPGPGMMMPLMQQASGRHADQQLSGHADNPHRHHHHHRQAHKEHRRSDEEYTPRSHHRESDGHRHGNGNSGRHNDHYHGGRGHHSEERARHNQPHHHQRDQRNHPYRR